MRVGDIRAISVHRSRRLSSLLTCSARSSAPMCVRITGVVWVLASPAAALLDSCIARLTFRT
jgi:hypothetical protein